MKSTLVSSAFLGLLLLSLSPQALADMKKPDAGRWHCQNRDGTRYCYHKGESCKLVKSSAGNYWVCEGPLTTSRKIMVDKRLPAAATSY